MQTIPIFADQVTYGMHLCELWFYIDSLTVFMMGTLIS